MAFNTAGFLFLFFPAAFLLYRLMPGRRTKNVFLAIASALFYGFGGLASLPVLLAACPSAMVVTALCLQYERSDAFASKCIFLSAVLSAVTIPLLIWLLF